MTQNTKVSRITRVRQGRYRVCSTWARIPEHLTRHFSVYRKIGHRIFVIKVPKQDTQKTLLSSKTMLRDLVNLYGPKKQLGEMLSEKLKERYVPATDKEIARYEAAVTRLNNWLRVHQERQEARRAAKIERECRAAIAVLMKHGRWQQPVCNRPHSDDSADYD